MPEMVFSMHIAVTGGTGYLGAHIVSGLLAAGHSVNLLVEPGWSNDVLMDTFTSAGTVAVVRGDLRSPAVLDGLLADCDAVLHAAGVVGTDNRREQLMWDINAYASERIMHRGVAMGLDPIVLLSSYSALFPPPGRVIGPDSPTAQGKSAYARTKDVYARVMRPGGGPKRYLCGGQMLTFDEMIAAIERGSGRRIRRIPMSPGMFRLLGRASDLAASVVALGSGFSYEAAQLITAAIPTDDSETLRDLNLTWRAAGDAIIATFALGATA
jgi:hypothetical protein